MMSLIRAGPKTESWKGWIPVKVGKTINLMKPVWDAGIIVVSRLHMGDTASPCAWEHRRRNTVDVRSRTSFAGDPMPQTRIPYTPDPEP